MNTKYNIGDMVWVIKNVRFNDFITKKENYNKLEYWIDAEPDWVKIKDIIVKNKKIIYVVNDYRFQFSFNKQIDSSKEKLLYFEESDLYNSEKKAMKQIENKSMLYKYEIKKITRLEKPILSLNYSEEVWAFTLGVIAIIAITGIVLQNILPPTPNPCEKYGTDWSLERVAYRTKACVNSSGDIKYIQ